MKILSFNAVMPHSYAASLPHKPSHFINASGGKEMINRPSAYVLRTPIHWQWEKTVF